MLNNTTIYQKSFKKKGKKKDDGKLCRINNSKIKYMLLNYSTNKLPSWRGKDGEWNCILKESIEIYKQMHGSCGFSAKQISCRMCFLIVLFLKYGLASFT